MDTLLSIANGIAGLVSLVCFIMVIIQMFRHGATGIGIACIVLAFCCGLGGLVAFIYGWVKAREWNITTLMIVWTIAILVGIGTGIANPSSYTSIQQSFNSASP